MEAEFETLDIYEWTAGKGVEGKYFYVNCLAWKVHRRIRP